ncbi:MAG: universal stress protein [Planctomycetia bacterium]|nr:universal stress protein [Planctomycetia bacterium]
MNPLPVGSHAATTGAALRALAPAERSLLAVLTGNAYDDALLRYAASWVESAETPTVRPAERTPVATRSGKDLCVSVPQAVQSLRLPSGQRLAPPDLLARSAAGDIDALLVGEAGARALACDLVRRAGCSVWFVPEGANPITRRLLVPVDFSLPAADSLRVAAVLARLCGANECIVLHVYFDDAYLSGSWGQQAVQRSVWTAFDRFMKPIDTLGVKLTPCFAEATDLPRTIREVASTRQADLIVMSSRGRSGAAALWQPTVAEQTLLTTAIPLLAVKHFGAARGFLSLLAERLRTPPAGLRCN